MALETDLTAAQTFIQELETKQASLDEVHALSQTRIGHLLTVQPCKMWLKIKSIVIESLAEQTWPEVSANTGPAPSMP